MFEGQYLKISAFTMPNRIVLDGMCTKCWVHSPKAIQGRWVGRVALYRNPPQSKCPLCMCAQAGTGPLPPSSWISCIQTTPLPMTPSWIANQRDLVRNMYWTANLAAVRKFRAVRLRRKKTIRPHQDPGATRV
jgi:hypothetical protein